MKKFVKNNGPNHKLFKRSGDFNIMSDHQQFISDLELKLTELEKELLAERIHFIVFTHGANSHEWDELASCELTTEEWLQGYQMVYSFV